jgi:thioredoxin 1
MKRLVMLVALALLAQAVVATQWPYDEKANARADLGHALAQAQSDHKNVLLVFGANWCENCRDLDKAMRGRSRPLIDGKFEVVKIDVGNFDKNLDLARRYGDPIKQGIPALVELSADDQVIYSTRGGELVDAHKMGDQGIYDFLARLAPVSSSGGGGSDPSPAAHRLAPMARVRLWGW